MRLSADARRQRCNLWHTLHRCGPGLRFHILSILPWAVIPKLTIMMSVRRARPPHHKFGADGVVPQRWSVSGLACQRICGGSGAEQNKQQGGQGPHGNHPLRCSQSNAGNRPSAGPPRLVCYAERICSDCNLARAMRPAPSAEHPICLKDGMQSAYEPRREERGLVGAPRRQELIHSLSKMARRAKSVDHLSDHPPCD